MKIILFLLLLYFCDNENCVRSGSPSKAQDCLSREVDNTENMCCYVNVESSDDEVHPHKCLEIPKSCSTSKEREDKASELIGDPKQISIKVQCNDEKNGETNTRNSFSYLKIGFLFILGLLF